MGARNVLVTGAAGGVGRATVARLDAAGWRVFAGVRSAGFEGPGNVTPVELDVCDPASIASARDRIADLLAGAGLHGLVNNAGLSVDGPLELVPVDRLRQQFEVNVIGQLAVCQAFLPLLRDGRGRIVNIGGAAGRMPLPMLGALSASKAALDAASDALRMELAGHGVAVSYVEPGGLDTGFFAKSAHVVATRGLAGGEAERARYAPAMKRAAEAMARQKPAPVDTAAVAICRALTARRPRARYRVGREARVLSPLLRAFPTRLRDRALRASFGLTS